MLKTLKRWRVLEKYRTKEDVLITFRDLEQLPLGKTIQMLEGSNDILCTRLPNNRGGLSFRVEMEAGKYWQRHHHDCEETILVHKGELYDEETGNKSTGLLPVTISKDQVHYIRSLSRCEFYVEFKKP